jgi:hypothetical protein
MKRAIWSAPPPVPAGTMNSTGLLGSHAAAHSSGVQRAAVASVAKVRLNMVVSNGKKE